MKRRKKQQDLNTSEIQSFSSSFRQSNDRMPIENKHQTRDYFKTKYNSFKNSPLMSSNKEVSMSNEPSLSTIYSKKPGIKNFWQHSSITNTSAANIKKNRSRDGLFQKPSVKQNLQLKLKKKMFHQPKKSLAEVRREVNMPTLNSQNRKNISLIPKSQNLSFTNKGATALDNYHTKSFENVIESSSSIMFKNMKKPKPQSNNYQMNRKILAALANKNLSEETKKKNVQNDVIIVEENSINGSDAYSYYNESMKESKKLRTQDGTTEENQSENTVYDKLGADSTAKETQKQKSFSKDTSEDMKSGEEKHYGSDRRNNEYDDTFANEFGSPMEYKAISPSPHHNTSAMSREVGLDDRSSRLKEDDDKNQESTEFPMTAANTIIHFGKYLTEFEESEILNYMVVYYVNTNPKIDQSPTRNKKKKQRKDDNDIRIIKGQHLAYRFEVIESIGKGAFGEVIK